MYTIPDDFTLYPETVADQPIPLRVKTDELELWVEEDGLKSVMVISETLGALTELPQTPPPPS